MKPVDDTTQEKENPPEEAKAKDSAFMPSEAMTDCATCPGVHNEEEIFFRVRHPRRLHWSIAWSDLMMTMFILFAVMFIYQAAHRELQYGGLGGTLSKDTVGKGPETTPGDDRRPVQNGRLRLEMAEGVRRPQETFRLDSLKNLGQVKLTKDQAVRIVLPADLLFDTGKADLKPQAVDSLREVAAALRRTDDMINVVGHTDNLPMHSDQFATNWELSAVRACRVARFLIERMNISAERFYVSGYSYFQPVKPNDSPEDRRQNRRVEIILTKKRPRVEYPVN
jgi:chemotaxis protein MotB